MASPSIRRYSVTNAQELEASMTNFFAQGFVVVNKTPVSVTLQKKKEFKIVWAVIGFLLCVIPLIIYLIVFATQPEVEVVEISISGQAIQPV